MDKLCRGLAALTVAVLAAQPALAEGPWYATLSGGVGLLHDAENTGTGFSIENSFAPGPVVLGAAGWKAGNGARVEGEISYRRNDLDTFDSISVAGTGAATGLGLAAGGSASALAFMANGAYDFDTGTPVSPYVLGGIGFARVSINDASLLGVKIADDSTVTFAYQLGLGANYKIDERWSVGLGYRFFGTANPEFNATDGTEFDTEYHSHAFLLGATVNF